MRQEDRETVLVVDDDPYTLESVSSLLEGYGYSVTTCKNAKDAIIGLRKENSEEFETMKNHTTVGEKMLSGSIYPAIQMAASIAEPS